MGLRACRHTRPQIEPQLDYWYKRYHGTLDGDAAIKQQINAIKTQAQATLFPPATSPSRPRPRLQDSRIRPLPAAIRRNLNLEDKEYILANGSDADATGLWALLKGQQTPVPGNVISDPATVLKITVTTAASRQAEGIRGQADQPRGLQRRSCSAHRIEDQGCAGLHSGQRREGRYRCHGRCADGDAGASAQDRDRARGDGHQRGRDAGRQGQSQRGLHRQHEGAALLQGGSGEPARCSGCSPRWSWTAPTIPTHKVPAAGYGRCPLRRSC